MRASTLLRFGPAALLAAMLVPAQAQPGFQANDPNTFVNAAQAALNDMSQGKAEDIWKEASAEMKKIDKRSAFVKNSAERYKDVGPAQQRVWVAINRLVMPQPAKDAKGPQPPAGQYVNVTFLSQFANNRSGFERVTYFLDPDGQWRVMGFALR
ncbi:MAG: hypothetical protein RL244_2262 [Pseudomonadota bacterium]|jgi:hypothetical protein